MQRCSGLLNRRARGSTGATHQPSPSAQRMAKAARRSTSVRRRALLLSGYGVAGHFADVAQQRQQQFRKLPGALPHESASLSIGSIFASVVKLLSSSASNGEFAGGSPAGCTSLRSERSAARGCRPVVRQDEGGQSPVAFRAPSVGSAGQFGMSTGRADRTCLLNSGLPEKGSVVRVHGIPPFRHLCARSSKRAGGLIPRIALDQCRVPERYRTRVPFRTTEREVAQAAQHFLKALGASRWKRPARSLILVPIAQSTEQARPKRQVAGESPAGDTSFAGVVQQQNAAVPRPRQRCDSVHRLHFRWECSSPAERSLDMREAERAALSAPTIFSRV